MTSDRTSLLAYSTSHIRGMGIRHVFIRVRRHVVNSSVEIDMVQYQKPDMALIS